MYLKELLDTAEWSRMGKRNLVCVTQDVLDKIVGLLRVDFLDVESLLDILNSFRFGPEGMNRLGRPGFVKISDIPKKGALESMVRSLSDFLLTLPVEYEILIPLKRLAPLWPENEELRISENIKMLRMEGGRQKSDYGNLMANFSKDSPFLESPTQGTGKKGRVLPCGLIYLSVRSWGYGYHRVTSPSFSSALTMMKIAIGSLIAHQVLFPVSSLADINKTMIVLNDVYDSLPNNQKGLCYVYPRHEYEDSPFSVRLPENLWYSVSRLSLTGTGWRPSEFEKIQIESGKKTQTQGDGLRRLQRYVAPLQGLFPEDYDPLSPQFSDVERVRTAIQWFYEGVFNENKTFSFVQLAVALEALLGEPKRKTNIGERLADRCAFLVGETVDERKKIKKQIEEAYDARSKIVHEGHTALNDKDVPLYEGLKHYLMAALVKEIRLLRRESGDRSQFHSGLTL